MQQSKSDSARPTVAIVLCSYNGELYINQQIESLLQQDWPVSIRVFDDVSSDSTLGKLERYTRHENVQVSQNPSNLGYVKNFEQGIQSVVDEGFEFIALCDQDDVWEPDRISRGMAAMLRQLNLQPPDSPLLVHSDLQMIDANSSPLHASFLGYRGYSIDHRRSIATILGQNGVMGNTVLMNKALATLALPFPASLPVHDYWLAVVCELFGKRVIIDGTPVHYRIHENNASNTTATTRFGTTRLLGDTSLRKIMRRDFRLPFKEDERLMALQLLLDQPQRFPALPEDDLHTVQLFLDYLRFDLPRWQMLQKMLSKGFIKPGVLHRLRVALSLMTTTRY